MKLSIKNQLFLFLLIPTGLILFLIYLFFFPDFEKKIENNNIKNSEFISSVLNEMINYKILEDYKKVAFFKESLNSENLSLYPDNEYLKIFLKQLLNSEKHFSSAWLMIYDLNYSVNQTFAEYFKTDNDLVFHITKLNPDGILFKKFTTFQSDILFFIYENEERTDINSFAISISVPFEYHNINGRIGINIEISKLGIYYKNIIEDELFQSFLFFENNLINLTNDIEYRELLLNNLIQKERAGLGNFSFYYNNKKIYVTQNDLNFINVGNKAKLITVFSDIENHSFIKNKLNGYILFSVIIILIYLFIISIILNTIRKRIKKTKEVIDVIARGRILGIHTINEKRLDELSEMNSSINKINFNHDITAQFIEELEQGNYNFEFQPVNNEDRIGNALLRLRTGIELSKQEEIKRKEIDEQQNWITGGAAKFAEIIREHSDNLHELAYAIISELVNYIGAVQGGLFIINEDENDEKHIELLASYAYNRNKMLVKRIPFGVGLVGRCILERETIYMTKVPDKYLNITSGLGDENPRALLIVPLIFHEEVFGVVELASFNEIEKYKIQLTEQISEGIASAVSMVKINVRTSELLRESKIKSEQAASQEEEIRQNIEEMQAITDELNNKLFVTEQIIKGINEISYYAEFDNQGRILDISNTYLKLIQKEKSEVIGKFQGSFSTEARNLESFNTFWEELRKGKILEYQQILNVADEMKNINSKYYPVKNSNGIVVKVISIAHIN